MVTDMLEQMNRQQLEAIAKAEKVRAYRYPVKWQLIAAIRRKRAKQNG